jgi:hypothetical protein
MAKSKAAQEMVKRRNEKYGKEWLRANAKKAGSAPRKRKRKIAA